MKSTTTKFTIIVSLILVIVGLAISFVVRASFLSVGIENINHTDDLKNLAITLEYSWGQDGNAQTLIDDLTNNQEYYINELDTAKCILIVEPTGALKQYRGSFSQTVKVVTVVKSAVDYVIEDDLITIFQYGGFTNVSGSIIYNQTSNIMYPDQMYLVFLDESELNTRANTKEFSFCNGIFACVKLTERNKQSPCVMSFNDGLESMQFCATDEILSAFERVEEAILEKYVAYE